jgi:hypothetical protein
LPEIAALSGSLPKAPGSVGGYLPIQEAMLYYLQVRKELTASFIAACVSAIFAISYQSQIFGFLLRRLVLFDLNRHTERAPDLVVSLQASAINGDHCTATA